MRIVETKLIASAGTLAKLPPEEFPEVAFAGRSNVGKSSLLNALTGRKGLFKVSQTPGRTRTIVHVETRLESGAKLYLVDLPGYGFAKVAKGAMEAWQKLIEGYLSDRSTLHLVVVLVDIRRGPEDEEVQLVDFLAHYGIPTLIVATKVDRVPKSKQKLELERLKKRTGIDVLGTSATDKKGLDALWRRVVTQCGYAESSGGN